MTAANRRMVQRSAPALALIRAFCPGPVDRLMQCESREWQSVTYSGERITVTFALPDAQSRARAFALVKLAEGPAGADIPVRGWMFVEVDAEVRGDQLIVDAHAVRD